LGGLALQMKIARGRRPNVQRIGEGGGKENRLQTGKGEPPERSLKQRRNRHLGSKAFGGSQSVKKRMKQGPAGRQAGKKKKEPQNWVLGNTESPAALQRGKKRGGRERGEKKALREG